MGPQERPDPAIGGLRGQSGGGGPCTGWRRVASLSRLQRLEPAHPSGPVRPRLGTVWALVGGRYSVAAAAFKQLSGWPSQRSSLWVSDSQNEAKWSTGLTASPARGPRKCQPGAGLGPRGNRLSPAVGTSQSAPVSYLYPTLAAPKTCALLPPASSPFHSPEIGNSTHWGGQAILAVPSPSKPRGLQHPPLCRAPRPIQRGAAPETLHPAFSNWHVRQEP